MPPPIDPIGSDIPAALTPEAAAALLAELLVSPPCADADHELHRLGLIIDLSDHFHRFDGIAAVLEHGEALLKADSLSAHQSALLHYFLGNAWDAARRLVHPCSQRHEWDQPEMEKQIIHLRQAVRVGSESDIGVARLCETCTNLGNLMNQCGRVVEAVAAWDAALSLDPGFIMALGNRGSGLLSYAMLVHDPGHQLLHLREAHRSLGRALSARADPQYKEAMVVFERVRARIEQAATGNALEKELSQSDFAGKWSKAERSYREWCMQHRLFLNDLNDLNLGAISAADVLTLPSLTTPARSPQPGILGFFNQIKQEYVSARYLYYTAIMTQQVHFSDRDVKLVNTLDYPSYGLSVEKTKLAFRVAYSLLDKVAYFLNDYLALKIPEKKVSFRGLWFQNCSPKDGLRKELHDLKNRALTGLFWLAKDIYDPRAEFVEAIEPEAQELATIRNHLEHKYLKLHEYGPPEPNSSGIGHEELAFSVGRREFAAKTLRLLQLVRSALIYLAQAVYCEEARRYPPGYEGLVMPMYLDLWEDDWKS